MVINSAVFGAVQLYLVSTHITRSKIIAAAVVVVVVVVAAVVFWLIRRRRPLQTPSR